MTYARLTDHPEIPALLEQGQILSVARNADRLGVKIDLPVVVEQFQKVNDKIDHIIGTYFPAEWEKVKADRAMHERVRDLAAQYEPLPTIWAIKAAFQQWAMLETIGQKVGVGGPGVPLLKARPDLLEPAAFFCHRLGIPLKRLPRLRLRSRESMPNAWGLYHTREHTIDVRADVPEDDLLKVLAHELTHADEGARGWDGSELYAATLADELERDWYREGRRAV